MKILLLGNQARSMTNFWSVLMQKMHAVGHEIVCCLPQDKTEQEVWAQKLRHAGYSLVYYPLQRKGITPVRDIRTLYALYKIFTQEKPDIVFTYTIKPVIYGCIAARLAGIERVFATITGLGFAFEADTWHKKCLRYGVRFLYTMALRRVKNVFFQNIEDKDVFNTLGMLPPHIKGVLCHGTGVDTVHFAYTAMYPSYPVFLLVARLLYAKGIATFAQAARILQQQYTAVRFQLLGVPEQGHGAFPLSTVQAWHRAGYIEYLGESADVRPYIAAASVLVLPSWREGTPCAILEGMSMGRPAVVTNVAGCREVVCQGKNGFLVPVHDARALAQAMEHFLLAPHLIQSMGLEGRRMAENIFDAHTVASHIMRHMAIY